MSVQVATRVLTLLPRRRGVLPAGAPPDEPIPPAGVITTPEIVIVPGPTPTPEITVQPKVKGGKKTGGTDQWGDSAIYINTPLKGDFRINYTVVSGVLAAFVIKNPALDASYTGDSHGIGHTATKKYQRLLSGVFGPDLGPYLDGDEFSIARIGNEIARYHEGIEIAPRTAAPHGTLYFKVAFYSVGAEVGGVGNAPGNGYGYEYGLSYGQAA